MVCFQVKKKGDALLMISFRYSLKRKNMKIFFVLLIVTIVVANETTKGVSEGWTKAVEDVLSHIVMGPLQPALRPTAFTSRNRTQVIQVQANQFRAHVLQNLLQSLVERVEICPWPAYVGQDAIQAVVKELKALEFQASWEPTPHWRCPGYGGYLLVHVPLPGSQ